MKKEILRISGHKNLKDFYKEFPDEDSFKAKYGKEFKKAQVGAMINKTNTQSSFKPINLDDIYNEYDFGNNMEEPQQVPQQKSQGAGGMDMGGLMKMFGGEGGDMSSLASSLAKYGTNIPRAQGGVNMPSWYQNTPTGLQNNWGQTQKQGNFPVPFDSGLDGSPGYQQQYNQNNNKIGSQINNDNLVSLTDDEVANKNEMYNGYSDANGPNGNKKAKNPMTGQQQVDLANSVASKAGFVGQAYNIIQGNREAAAAANQNKQVTAIMRKAENSYAQNVPENRFVQPTDNIFTNNQLGSGNGTGTNVLSKNGSSIKKMYNGGNTQPQGWENYGGDVGATVGNAFFPGMGEAFRPAGQLIGMGANFLDSNIKSANSDNAQAQRDLKAMSMEAGFNSYRGQNSSYVKNGGNIASYENGGYMNPEYNPQLITMFGDHNSEDFADYSNKFRAGGHLKSYTPPSERAMEIYKDGGNFVSDQVGGVSIESENASLEPISWNPNTGGTGFTSKFHGNSHVEKDPVTGQTGIMMKYGGETDQMQMQMKNGGDIDGNVIEAEDGEFISERIDPNTNEESAFISGNRKYNSKFYDLGEAFNKEFNNYKIKDIQDKVSQDDKKINILEGKNTKELLEFEPLNQHDKLKENALMAKAKGYKMQYDINALKIEKALEFQNFANEAIAAVGDIHGREINGDDFIKSAGNKINFKKESLDSSKSKNGSVIQKAQNGLIRDKKNYDYLNKLWSEAKNSKDKTVVKKFQKEYTRLLPENAKKITSAHNTTNFGIANKIPNTDPRSNIDGYFGPITDEYGYSLQQDEPIYNNHIDNTKAMATPSAPLPPIPNSGNEIKQTDAVGEKAKFPWEMYANQALQYLRPSNQEGLDPNQTYAERLSLANSHVDPIPYEHFNPNLDDVIELNRQASKNNLISQTRAAQRITQGNQALQANIAAEAYNPMQQLNEADFIDNQKERDRKFSGNRDKLNQAALTNIGFNKDYFDKKTQAYANTKAETLAALSSISDKYTKNNLENKKYNVLKNLYNFDFDSKGRAINMNGLAQLDWNGRGGNSKEELPEGWEYETIIKPKKKEAKSKNGSIVKSYKNI
jgi:hypothetical protein